MSKFNRITLVRFFGIDLKKVEDERCALLKYLQDIQP